jgi:GNAT superfamily N-acetyltransferase
MSPFRIQRVDGSAPFVAKLICAQHDMLFLGDEPLDPEYVKDKGSYWWLVKKGTEFVGFAGLRDYSCGVGYLVRCGILPSARGNGLQRRLIRARVRFAKSAGFKRLVSDTCGVPESSNNLYRAGFTMFTPERAWALPASVYWEKYL